MTRLDRLLTIATLALGALLAFPPQQAQSQQQSPTAAQRAVLYEEDPSEPLGKSYVGSVVWRIVTVTPKSGVGVDPAIRADVAVAERGVAMTFTLRRITDETKYATHRIEVQFDLSANPASGGIETVPGLLMKQAEQARGTPLVSQSVKIDASSFQIDLSAIEENKQRNLQLLRERSWFDIPIVYRNGRRAILALDKGAPGAEAFDAVFTAWGQ